MILPSSFPAELILDFGSGRDEEPSGEKILRLIQIRLTPPSLKKARRSVKTIRRNRKSPLLVPETPLAFHLHAQRNAFRHRDVRLQSRSFARWDQWLRRSPNSIRLCCRSRISLRKEGEVALLESPNGLGATARVSIPWTIGSA
jgi:hypothetical protein